MIRPRPAHDDRGAATVEFALIMVPLMALVFAIISYGYMLSFRQAISQAAAEGARAAVIAPPGIDAAERVSRAQAAIDAALGYGVTCASAGMDCQPVVEPCGTQQCVRIRLDYDWAGFPLLPTFPGLGVVMPANLVYETTAAVS